jgi:GDYXXLXY motif protein
VTRETRWLQAAVMLPLLGLLVMIARAEVLLRSGASFVVPIKGYDPRDLLHGHYLQYSFDFDWQGESTCGTSQPGKAVDLDTSCCVCLSAGATVARARQVRCDQVANCAWLSGSALAPPLRYFVPERQAAELEQALRERHAAVSLTCGPDGQPAIGDLYVDGRPWRELLDEE